MRQLWRCHVQRVPLFKADTDIGQLTQVMDRMGSPDELLYERVLGRKLEFGLKQVSGVRVCVRAWLRVLCVGGLVQGRVGNGNGARSHAFGTTSRDRCLSVSVDVTQAP